MTKILPFALVFLAALWFSSDTYAQENNDWSNLKELDFYFDDEALNESTQHGNSSKTKTTEFNKNDEHMNVDKPHSGGAHENIAIWNLKRLIRYLVSLLHRHNEHEEELLHGDTFVGVPYSKYTKIKSNQTSTSPRIYKGANTEKFSDAEFESSGGGNDSEYVDEDISIKNFYKGGSEIKLLKSNTRVKPRVRNHGEISGDQQKNRSDNQMSTFEVLQSDRERPIHSSLLYEKVSGEFIDEYINSPAEKDLESGERPATNQSISNRSGNQTYAIFKESSSKGNVSQIEDRKLINPQKPVSVNIATEINATLNKGLGKGVFSRNKSKIPGDTTHDAFLNQTGNLKKKNVKEISSVKTTTQNSFPSNKSTHFISDKPQNNTNCTLKITPFPAESTSKVFNGNSNSPEDIKLSHSKSSKILNVKNNMHDSSSKNFSVLDDSKNQSLKENRSLNSEPQKQFKKISHNTEKKILQQPLNSEKRLALQMKFNGTNRLLPQNVSIDTESKNDTDFPTEQHSAKYPKLEKQSWEYFNASKKLKIQTNSDRDYDSSENSDSEELYEYDDKEKYEDVQNMSNFANYFLETISNETTQSAENFSAPYTNYSMEMELPTSSKNDSKINTLHKTQEIFNSILEFLYKYSNSTWIKKLREENRRM